MDGEIPASDVDTLIEKHSQDVQSSAVCCLLHLAWSRKIQISEESWDAVAAANDALSNAYLLRLPPTWHAARRRELVTALAERAVDDYSKDENWPGRYIPFQDGREDMQDPSFVELQRGGVKLLLDPREVDDGDLDEDGLGDSPDDYYEDDFDESWTGLGYSG